MDEECELVLDGITTEPFISEEEMQFIEQDLTSQFGLPLSSSDVETLNMSVASRNTVKRNKLALKLFQKWQSIRHPLHLKSIKDFNPDELNDKIPRFIHEVRREDGMRYPNTSLVSIIAGNVISHLNIK
jgi:hypothetical protein